MMITVMKMRKKTEKQIRTCQVRCELMDSGGKGVVSVEGKRWAIEDLLVREQAQIQYEVCGNQVRIQEVWRTSDSADRTEPRCHLSRRCGGCQLQHMQYQAQLHWKQQQVQRLMGRWGTVQPICGMEDPWHYRNKVIASLAYNKKGKIVAGIYEEESHRVVGYSFCMIQDPRAAAILHSLCQIMEELKLEPYQEDKRRGLIRHCLIRLGQHSGQILVCLVTASAIFPARRQLVERLRQRHPEITTLVMNVNSRSTSVVLGQQERVLWGKGTITDRCCGLDFTLSARSFYQVNSAQTEVLYRQALRMAGLNGKQRVLDAYCGIGTIGLIAASKSKEVIGVEVNAAAVNNAITNARSNRIRNAFFLHQDAGQFMEQAAREHQHFDVVLMDPPRSGADDRFLNSLVRLNPQRIVYISCNPFTQAQDVKKLVEKGYGVREMVPVDMFPMTVHTELICLLVRE